MHRPRPAPQGRCARRRPRAPRRFAASSPRCWRRQRSGRGRTPAGSAETPELVRGQPHPLEEYYAAMLTVPRASWFAPVACLLLLLTAIAGAQSPVVVLRADRVFDGERMQTEWAIVVRGDRIEAAGPIATTTAPAGARTITVPPGPTLMPGVD